MVAPYRSGADRHHIEDEENYGDDTVLRSLRREKVTGGIRPKTGRAFNELLTC